MMRKECIIKRINLINTAIIDLNFSNVMKSTLVSLRATRVQSIVFRIYKFRIFSNVSFVLSVWGVILFPFFMDTITKDLTF